MQTMELFLGIVGIVQTVIVVNSGFRFDAPNNIVDSILPILFVCQIGS